MTVPTGVAFAMPTELNIMMAPRTVSEVDSRRPRAGEVIKGMVSNL
jgi:hypothetical protein